MRWLEKYRLCTRVALPLAMAYTAGFFAGQLLYYKIGHLGLIWGPLGELRRAILQDNGPSFYASGTWLDWLFVAVFLAIFLVEVWRLRGSRMTPPDSLLLAGYLLAALWTVTLLHLGRSRAWEAVAVLALLTGMALGIGAWSHWRTVVRALAIVLFVLGVAVAAWSARRDDLRRLGASCSGRDWDGGHPSVQDQRAEPGDRRLAARRSTD